MKRATRSLLFLVMASGLLLFAFAPRYELLDEQKQHIHMRGIFDPPAASSGSANPSTPANTQSQAPSTTPPVSTAPSTPTSTPASSTPPPSSTAPSSTPANTNTLTTSTSLSTPGGSTVVGTTTTNADGQVVTSVITIPDSTTSSAVPSHTNTNSNDSGGLGTGSIIGLSVAGGVAAIGIISFFVWKFTRKRFADFDDNEAIKWPELNTHGGNEVHALPTNSTGRAGFGAENDSDVNLTRAPSPGGGYAHSVAASSVPEVYGTGQDPYAVPPLPHLNPNQPYRDDPGAYGQPAGYYDPYRGPVPNTFGDALSDGHGVESIPMTQMRTRSPGPQVAYDMQARASPAPQAALGYGGMDDRSRSPNPAAMGRASPGPQAAYSYGPR